MNTVTNSREAGAALSEYVILVAFLAIAVIGVLGTLGNSTRNKLCSTFPTNFDLDGNGIVDEKDNHSIARVEESGQYIAHYDLNCDGQITYGTSGSDREVFDDYNWN